MTILAIAFAAMAGFILGLKMPKQKSKHEHIWRPVSAGTVNVFGNVADHPIRRFTRVLNVCYCSATNTTEVEGHWSFEELTNGLL